MRYLQVILIKVLNKIFKTDFFRQQNFLNIDFFWRTLIMYPGFKPPTQINKSLLSSLNQSSLQTLQREVDCYTLKLEQQKRKYFSIQDQHKSISLEYTKQKEILNQLKKQASKPETMVMQAKVKNIQASLAKAISLYDDTVAGNNQLKASIDMLRREKKNFIQMQRNLDDQLHKLEQQAQDKSDTLIKKRKKAEQLKQQIMNIKVKNDQQRESYMNQFSSLQKQHLMDMNQQSLSSSKAPILTQPMQKFQPTDTQPLLKFRLKRLISQNKQKLKMIDQYKKHMLMIQDAFKQIREKSNIHDLQEITNLFIKSEEQNYSLYNYMDQLQQEIDRLDEENRLIEHNIATKQIHDQQRKDNILNDNIIIDQKHKQAIKIQTKNNTSEIFTRQPQNQELDLLISRIKPVLSQTLLQLASSQVTRSIQTTPSHRLQDYLMSLTITDRNIQQYLGDLQNHINALLLTKQQVQTKTTTCVKDSVTVYTKGFPSLNLNQEVNKERDGEQRFMEHQRFREFAVEFWDKRRANQSNGNSNNTNNNTNNNSNSNNKANPPQKVTYNSLQSNLNNNNISVIEKQRDSANTWANNNNGSMIVSNSMML